ncbi:MAG: molybdopterin molybdotransferase MoeA [gamma proteobacterium symbiont of Bathyaustriella thionipta]|nr:molybdopterin molybdotransferase MoeA [gamma proteobacterium symbiont of Bathyaustriella thionipta]MCU7949533.1 molybdopterin molybdotransferase MoeA [gamma proteobacterium symbiont of Bathyaustriella thionipta]MCU7954251.1 molybdopterin molybdotransferase MoeA [gamma proteobacterium symbiont of Bathyaustriella thionipta]MCU7956133.1 molybdopterin molybdotransferase MoeA [gamma proteobacterium symbiont of Bathyaustriella thionipta]MCU7968734.1 molybdopterin molybdotransferase MoeA [gamma pro
MSQNDNQFLSVSDVQKRIISDIKAIDGTEKIDLRQALNRILAEDVTATFDTPPCDNSGMDGYAFSSQELESEQSSLTLKVAGQSFAGHPYVGKIASGEAIRIMTGAQVPEGVDTVVMQEHTEKPEEDIVKITTIPKAFANVRKAGDDLTTGQTFLAHGKKLSPTDLAFLATQGIAEVRVTRKLRVAFFSTGDELKSIGETLGEGDIYDSNRYSLYGLLKNLDIELIDMGVIADDRSAIEEAFNTAASVADAVITSGGVSVGEADFVKETLEKVGQINFWKIAMKPGKPLAFGSIGDSLFFGLPGNPVSVIATFYQFVQPALKRMKGQDIVLPLMIKAKTTELLKKRPGRTDFQRGILEQSDNGELTVRNAGAQASHVLTSMSRANCFMVIPAQSGNIEAGEWVDVQPFEGLLG